MEEPKIAEHLPYIHSGLIFRVIFYFVLAVIIIGISIYHIIIDDVFFLYPLLALVTGAGLGIIASRIFVISWDHGAGKVIAEFDILGIILLVLYIFFEIYREKIVEYFIQGPSVVAISFALLAGVMIGRVLGIQNKIAQVLNENV